MAELDGTVVGAVAYVPRPGPFAEEFRDGDAGFRMLAVDAEAQGNGVGEALVRTCIARARADGRSALALFTMPSMAAAHRLYERLGFVRTTDRDWQVSDSLTLWSYVLPLTSLDFTPS